MNRPPLVRDRGEFRKAGYKKLSHHPGLDDGRNPCGSLWPTPPSFAGRSSYEDKADSYNYDTHSDGLNNGGAGLRVRDGDACHIAMKSIRMKGRQSISQINSYAESDKRTLYITIGRSPFLPDIPACFLTSNRRTAFPQGGFAFTNRKMGVSMGLSTEVLVVGGGPAGLAAAIASRKKGLSVIVVDGAKPPIDKPCGEGLLPGTLAALRQLGICIQAEDGQTFQRMRFIDGSISATANFPGGGGVGVRRTVLHQRMVVRAEESGVELLWNTPVTSISRNRAIASGQPIQAEWIVGADGIHSRVRQWSSLNAGGNLERRFAQRRHYRVKLLADCVEVYWGRRTQAYVTPLAGEETCVVLISCDPATHFDEALREFPKLADILRNAELRGVQRGAVTATCRLDPVCRENIALVGDASGSVDAITGEGLGLSFRQALALADALEAGNLGKYQSAHRQLARRPHVMSRLLLLLDRCARLRRRVLLGLAKDPDLFSRLLTAHITDTSPAFLAETGARLGWRLITA